METRQRIARTRPSENEIVGKTMGPAGRQRTTLGQINSKSVDLGPTKPVVRTTRTQQLRNKMIEKKRNESSKLPLKVTLKEVVEERVEAMDISVNLETHELKKQILEVQTNDAEDEHLVGDYVDTCYEYLRYLEHSMAIRPRYLDERTEITPKMRSILVDWLVQVHKRFKLQTETLYLTVAILDRYLQQAEKASKNEMQLIGITSMMIACKYEEIYSPEIDDFVYICDNAYTSDQIMTMELGIVEALDYNLGMPMSIQFLRRYSKTAQVLGEDVVNGNQHALAKYLLELALTDYDLCSIKPSLLAAAALKLSLEILTKETWGAFFQHYSEYTEEEIEFTVTLFSKCLYQMEFTKTGARLTAVKKKYSEPKFFSIAQNQEIGLHKEMLYERARKAKESLSEKLKK